MLKVPVTHASLVEAVKAKALARGMTGIDLSNIIASIEHYGPIFLEVVRDLEKEFGGGATPPAQNG